MGEKKILDTKISYLNESSLLYCIDLVIVVFIYSIAAEAKEEDQVICYDCKKEFRVSHGLPEGLLS